MPKQGVELTRNAIVLAAEDGMKEYGLDYEAMIRAMTQAQNILTMKKLAKQDGKEYKEAA